MSHAIGHYEKVRALAIGPRLLAVGGVRAPATERCGRDARDARETRETRTRSPAGASQVTLFDHVANKPVRSIDVPAHVLGLAFAGDLLAAACSDGALRLLAGGGADARGRSTRTRAAPRRSPRRPAARLDRGGRRRAGVFRVGEAAGSPAPQPGAAVEISSFALSAAPLAPSPSICRRALRRRRRRRRRPRGHAVDGRRSRHARPRRAGRGARVHAARRRLASGGDDGTVRLWYLVGDVECEVRGADRSGHAGGVRAPVPAHPAAAGRRQGERRPPAVRRRGRRDPHPPARGQAQAARTRRRRARCRSTRSRSRRPPRARGARAGEPAAGPTPKDRLGAVFAAGDRRTVWRFPIDAAGAPADGTAELAHGFDVLAQALSGARPAARAPSRRSPRSTSPRRSRPRSPCSDRTATPSARARRPRARGEGAAAAREAARGARRRARTSRMAALEALRAIERDTPLAPLRPRSAPAPRTSSAGRSSSSEALRQLAAHPGAHRREARRPRRVGAAHGARPAPEDPPGRPAAATRRLRARPGRPPGRGAHPGGARRLALRAGVRADRGARSTTRTPRCGASRSRRR